MFRKGNCCLEGISDLPAIPRLDFVFFEVSRMLFRKLENLTFAKSMPFASPFEILFSLSYVVSPFLVRFG